MIVRDKEKGASDYLVGGEVEKGGRRGEEGGRKRER